MDIDNWRVRVLPPCTLDAECDDGDACTTDACADGLCTGTPLDCDEGDACTTDTCTSGTCQHPPLDCDDGNECTLDACSAGTCTNVLSADYATVIAKVDDLRALLAGSACGEEPLATKLRKKLSKRVKKARKALDKADDATKAALVQTLVAKANTLLDKGQAALTAAWEAGLISLECANTLYTFIDEIQTCSFGLPPP